MSSENVLYLDPNGGTKSLVVEGVEIPNIDAGSGISVEFDQDAFPRVTVTLIAPELVVIADPSEESVGLPSGPFDSKDGAK